EWFCDDETRREDLMRLRIFLACALGAFLGGMTANEMGVFWIFGAMLGGFVSYASYNFREIIAAIPHAWRAATSFRPKWVKIGRILNTVYHDFCGGLTIGFTAVSIFMILRSLFMGFSSINSIEYG